ncbi:acyl-CoA dehydrogenase family protein [Rhodovibrionaceae bacterium A322]
MTYSSQFAWDSVDLLPPKPPQGGQATHEVRNMPPELPERNLYSGNQALQEVAARAGLTWATDKLTDVGQRAGSHHYRELARLADKHLPVLRSYDRVGNRAEYIEYHPAYHALLGSFIDSGYHSLCWDNPNPRPQTARAILAYLWNQVEVGISCPALMTYSFTALLNADPEMGERWRASVLSTDYDPRHIAPQDKRGLTVAMSMTEKQGGSDLRATQTTAKPTGQDREFVLTGHKFFCSAPMGDLVLLTAQTDKGVTLFVAPRLLPDGTRNGINIQRLKDKLGNRSNASSEIELTGALAYRIGEEGHGIRTAIQYMCHYMRLDLSLSSASIIRQSLTLALHHTSNRTAFGKQISTLPQMVNGLADLALESEAAMALCLRVAQATDDAEGSERERLLNRILVPTTKFWNCRRAGAAALEALECHGGMGFVEEQPIARFYREAPINSIWEGTSAMMGMDFVRAIDREDGVMEALFDEARLARGADRTYDSFVSKLEQDLHRNRAEDLEPHARRLMSGVAKMIQASLLIRYSPAEMADAFCHNRLGANGDSVLGTLEGSPSDLSKIVARAEIAA